MAEAGGCLTVAAGISPVLRARVLQPQTGRRLKKAVASVNIGQLESDDKVCRNGTEGGNNSELGISNALLCDTAMYRYYL